jgi:hypothetical protein
VALLGYGWAVLGITFMYWTQWTGTYNGLFDVAFLAGLPGVLLTLIGSSLLGAALLRNRFRPVPSALLLLGAFPLALLITQVTSMGSAILPIAFAFAIAGRDLASPASETEGRRAVASVR